jgi:hypothetical protein
MGRRPDCTHAPRTARCVNEPLLVAPDSWRARVLPLGAVLCIIQIGEHALEPAICATSMIVS